MRLGLRYGLIVHRGDITHGPLGTFFCCIGVCLRGLLWALMSIQSLNSFAGNRSRGRPIAHFSASLKEFGKTSVILARGARTGGYELQSVPQRITQKSASSRRKINVFLWQNAGFR